MRIKFIDQVYCKVEPKEDAFLIDPCLQYPSERWKEGAYHNEKIEKISSMCDKRSRKFLAGLYPRVISYCKDNNIPIEVQALLDFPGTCKPALPGIEFREDQVAMFNKVIEFRRGLIVGPPGIGKTVIAGGIISMFSKSTVAMVVHTEALFSQTIENFQNWFGKADVGIIGNQTFALSRVNVIMAQTARAITAVDKKGKCSHENIDAFVDLLLDVKVLIIDECHHAGNSKGMYAKVCACCAEAPIKIGMTATPLHQKKQRHAALTCEGLIGPIIGQLTLQEGIEKGLLAVPKVKLIPVPFNAGIADRNRTYGPSYKYEDNVKILVSNGIYKDAIILNRARNRLVVKAAAERVALGDSVLIMITDVINEQGKMLQEMGHDIYGLDISLVQGPTESDTRTEIKKALQSKSIKCVVTTTVWREGINIPSLDCVIWASGGKADIATLQGLGRGLRTTTGKTTFTLIDFLDPYKYLARHTIERLRVYIENGCL